MFRCEKCGETTKAGEPMNRVVVETRAVQYRDRDGAVVGIGYETVREMSVGQCCKTE